MNILLRILPHDLRVYHIINYNNLSSFRQLLLVKCFRNSLTELANYAKHTNKREAYTMDTTMTFMNPTCFSSSNRATLVHWIHSSTYRFSKHAPQVSEENMSSLSSSPSSEQQPHISSSSPTSFSSSFQHSMAQEEEELVQASTSPMQHHTITITDQCIQRMKVIARRRNVLVSDIALRLRVDSGGCSGFSYKFIIEPEDKEKSIDSQQSKSTTDTTTATSTRTRIHHNNASSGVTSPVQPHPDDVVIERNGLRVFVDDMSIDYLDGCTIHYEEDMMRAAFVILSNPHAEGSCSCGTSFAPKL